VADSTPQPSYFRDSEESRRHQINALSFYYILLGLVCLMLPHLALTHASPLVRLFACVVLAFGLLGGPLGSYSLRHYPNPRSERQRHARMRRLYRHLGLSRNFVLRFEGLTRNPVANRLKLHRHAVTGLLFALAFLSLFNWDHLW
jgi:hypothetical protein